MQLNRKLVLWAVMASQTPIGSIIDRLKTKLGVPRENIDNNEVLNILNELIEQGWVLANFKNEPGGLYRKIPHAMEQMEEAEKN